jgi:hypothetical protein
MASSASGASDNRAQSRLIETDIKTAGIGCAQIRTICARGRRRGSAARMRFGGQRCYDLCGGSSVNGSSVTCPRLTPFSPVSARCGDTQAICSAWLAQ